MARVQCKNSHFYNDSQHSVCPTCGVPGLKGAMPQTEAVDLAGKGGSDRLEAKSPPPPANSRGAAGVTVGLFQKQTGIDPVVGWLVCVKGVNKGRDYRLKSDVNKVGRATNMNVCIEGDDTISRDSHFQVVYSPRNKHFSIVPDSGGTVVYLNGEDVLQAIRLKAYDRIEVGETTLLFLPLCSSDFDWSMDKADDDVKTPARGEKEGVVSRPADHDASRGPW